MLFINQLFLAKSLMKQTHLLEKYVNRRQKILVLMWALTNFAMLGIEKL